MPPQAKITKTMILDTVLELTRETGFETVNARSIADRLQCSTRPIFTCYKNMEELKRDFLQFAFVLYERYTANYRMPAGAEACLHLPLSYIAFAGEEANLFKLLFISDMELDMATAEDFWREEGNVKKAKVFSKQIGIEPEQARGIFLDLFLYSHGIAVLTATGKMSLNSDQTQKMLSDFLSASVRQKRGNG